jgi:hypothetical protein
LAKVFRLTAESSWFEDDPSVDDGDDLVRRLPHALKPGITIDPITGNTRPHIGSMQYTGNGLSVYMDSELRRMCVTTELLCPGNDGAFSFSVNLLRELGGRVTRDPVSVEENEFGDAHALSGQRLAPSADKAARREWSAMRDALIRSAVWIAIPTIQHASNEEGQG